jgi:signal transduction histidine kinase
MKNFFRRSTFIVNPKLQYFITGSFLTITLINLIFFIIAHSIIETKILNEAQSFDPQSQRYLVDYVSNMLASFKSVFILFSTFTMIIAFAIGSILLNHIAGPAYAIKKQLEDIVAGRKPRQPLILRKYDFFTDIADSVNALTDKLNLIKKEDDK